MKLINVGIESGDDGTAKILLHHCFYRDVYMGMMTGKRKNKMVCWCVKLCKMKILKEKFELKVACKWMTVTMMMLISVSQLQVECDHFECACI